MHEFQPFLDAYGTGHDCTDTPAASLERYEGKLPASLLAFWRDEGFCGYRDGMFWFVNPDDFTDALDEWKAASYTAFARNGFGDLFLWSDAGIALLNVHLGSVNDMGGSDLNAFINKLITRELFMDDLLFRQIHTEVVPRLGRIGPDECYAFTPALALGGPGTPASVERVRLSEQLSILAQIHGR